MIRTSIFAENNYKSVYCNGKTMRFAIDPKQPITELEYPEFMDVKITSKCEGKCPWCYMDSKPEDEHSVDPIGKIDRYFGSLTQNQRPFQVAIGGGEPTSHPQFIEILEKFEKLGICPNYTTNGMWVDSDNHENIISATKKLCGGVAVSCHPQLKKYWKRAANAYHDAGIKLNFHIIISDKKSIDDFMEIYEEWHGKVDYFVLLPYGNQGRATNKKIDWNYLCKVSPEKASDLAFGANFYPYLQKNPSRFDVSLYEPEIMSKFLDISDMSVHKSSFSLNS